MDDDSPQEEHNSIINFNNDADDVYRFMKELDDIRKEDRYERYRKILTSDFPIEDKAIPKIRKKKKNKDSSAKPKRKTLYQQSTVRKTFPEPKIDYKPKKISKKNVEKTIKRLAPEPTKKPEKKEIKSPVRQRPSTLSEEELAKENQKRKEAAFQKRALKFIDDAFCVESNEIDKLTEEQLEIALANLGILNCPRSLKSDHINTIHISDFPELAEEALKWKTQSRRNRGNIYSSRAAQRSIRDVFLNNSEDPFSKLIRNSVIIQMMNGANKPKPLFDPNNPNCYISEYSAPQTPTSTSANSPRNSAAQTPTFSTSGRVQWSGSPSPRSTATSPRPASSPLRPPPLRLPQPPVFEDQSPELIKEEAQMSTNEKRETEADNFLKNQALALFPVENTIDKEALTKLMKRLNLISKDIIEKHSLVADFVEDWKVKPGNTQSDIEISNDEAEENQIFDVESVRKTIGDAIVSKNRTRVQSEIKICILTARANGALRVKKEEEPPQQEPPTKKVVLTKDRLNYLSNPRSPPEKKPRKSLPKRPVFKMNPLAQNDELQPNRAFSYRSKEILAESKNLYMSMKFTERERKMEEDRQKMLKKMQRDSLREQKKSQWHSDMTKEEQEMMREKVEARKKRDRQRLEEETTPSFRPEIDADMERLKKMLRSDVQKPHGWTEEVERHRMTNKKYLEESEPEKPKKNTRTKWPKPPPRVQYKAEDLRLIAAIIRYGPRDWKQIAEFVGGGRNSSQCNQRWCRALDPTINHTPWTPEEDEQLQRAVKVLGRTSWCQVAKIVTGRTDLQCRYRFLQLSRSASDKGPVEPQMEQKPVPAEPKVLEAPSPDVKIQRRNSISIAQFEMPEIHPGHKPFKQIRYFLHSDTLKPRCDNGAFLHRLPPRISFFFNNRN